MTRKNHNRFHPYAVALTLEGEWVALWHSAPPKHHYQIVLWLEEVSDELRNQIEGISSLHTLDFYSKKMQETLQEFSKIVNKDKLTDTRFVPKVADRWGAGQRRQRNYRASTQPWKPKNSQYGIFKSLKYDW